MFIGNYSLEADMWAAGMTMYQLLVRFHGYLYGFSAILPF